MLLHYCIIFNVKDNYAEDNSYVIDHTKGHVSLNCEHHRKTYVSVT